VFFMDSANRGVAVVCSKWFPRGLVGLRVVSFGVRAPETAAHNRASVVLIGAFVWEQRVHICKDLTSRCVWSVIFCLI